MAEATAKRPSSISTRMGWALAIWALCWGVLLAGAAWFAAREEIHELLDDTLQVAAIEMLAPLLQAQDMTRPLARFKTDPTAGGRRLAWQVVTHGSPSAVVQASEGAPPLPFFEVAMPGFASTPSWRVYGHPLHQQAAWLYVAHAQEERLEARLELALAVAIVTLPMALLALLGLRMLLGRELQPLQRLTQKLREQEAALPRLQLGPPERRELDPMHRALTSLAQTLQDRLARERAFTAHAAHALRTPLAGMDAQLAVALLDASAEQQPRLQRVRLAAGRLQRVVQALLALFRSKNDFVWQDIDLQRMVERSPEAGWRVEVEQHHDLRGDPDLLQAALLNLLDNVVKHGASQARVDTAQAQVLRVHDDGAGVSSSRRSRLLAALQGEDAEGPEGGREGGRGHGAHASGDDHGRDDSALGLGLQLADLVARAHGGRLHLPEVSTGFTVELHLGPGPERPGRPAPDQPS